MTAEPLEHGGDPAVLARADVELSSGQPEVPLTFTYRLAEPLPEDDELVLISRDVSAAGLSEPASAEVIRPVLSDDRRTASAQVDHLSVKEWVIARAEEANQFVTSAAGLRSEPPVCESQPRPSWLETVVFTEGNDAPMLVCTGADPRKPGTAVVKIRNNRGVAMIVTAPTVPDWTYLETHSGDASAFVAEVLTSTTEALQIDAELRPRTWVLPPGTGLDMGFSEASLEPFNGSSQIKARVSTSSLAYGVLWEALEEVTDNPAMLTALELGFIGVCLTEGVGDAVSAADTGTIVGGLTSAAVCAVQRTPEILAEIQARVSPNTWNYLLGKGLAKNVTKLAGKLVPVLTIAKSTVVIGDALSTLALPGGAYEIGLFTVVKPPPLDAATVCGGTVKETRQVPHPALGGVEVSTVLNGGTGLSGGGCIAAIDAKGQLLIKVDLAVYRDALDFATPETDSTGNIFLTYNPGRYNGVVTLVPNASGFEPISWDDGGPNYQTTRHVYYSAELEGPGSDGEYMIRSSINDCTPSCAGGTVTETVLRWDGRAYSG